MIAEFLLNHRNEWTGTVILVFLFFTSWTPQSLWATTLSYDTSVVTVRTTSDTILGRVSVRNANTPVKRYIGLRHVDSLDTDAGMLFIYPEANPRSFTMEDMKIPLDIVYADSSGRILSIHPVRPGVSSIPSGQPARYVLEVNHGWCQVRNVQPGDRLEVRE